ncbi:MAG: ATP-binding cassette domain-containing protein [Balneolaceae bacterium]|nr:ATP-binding cassette domain-containing protein [Balneolaceae bacterium]
MNRRPYSEDFSLEIKKGTRVALKGESGAGKTTLLRLLLGFEQADAGNIYVEREPVSENNFATIRSSTAWLPQDLNIGDGTVEEVINRIFEFRSNRTDKPESGKIKNTLEKLGLSDTVFEKSFSNLSTGQRQRVGLTLCHLLDRPLLLLDEPTSALDRKSKQKAADLLLSDLDRTVISTTHDPFWLEKCDEIVEL